MALIVKWKALFAIYFQECLAYRASALIWITTDLVTAVTMPLVWASASSAGAINGFSTSDFVLYYLCMLLVSSFVTSHIMWEVATEIREGIFQTHLLRPIGLHQLMFFRHITWRLFRCALFLPIFLGLLFLYRGYLGGAQVNLGPEAWVAVLLGNLVSFSFVMLMASVALWVQEVTSIFELYYIPMLFLSGQIVPVALLPDWAQRIALFFPFYYTAGVPTEILVGRLSGSAAWTMIVVQLAWVVGCSVLSQVTWRRGLRSYAGVGM